MISPREIARGLVLCFDPEILLRCGARPSGPITRAVQGPHYFVCIERWPPGLSLWSPAFSRYERGRIKLRCKSGSRDWTGQPSFVDLDQLWLVPHQAIGPGSGTVDHTTYGNRNRASRSFLFVSYEPREAA